MHSSHVPREGGRSEVVRTFWVTRISCDPNVYGNRAGDRISKIEKLKTCGAPRFALFETWGIYHIDQAHKQMKIEPPVAGEKSNAKSI